MGARGPIPGAANAGRPHSAQARQPNRRRRAASTSLVALPTPSGTLATPDDLGPVARATWDAIADLVPGRHELDVPTLVRYCRVTEERHMFRAALDQHGATLTEPIVSPSGAVVGERVVPNPAEQMLRRADKALDSLAAQLALSPQARARLGLTVVTAEATAAEMIDRLRSG